VIDIHCHILPDVDDGPLLLKSSLAMAAIAAEDGITVIIATPHTDGIRVNRETVAAKVRYLNRELDRHAIPLAIVAGHELPYHLLPNLASSHTLADSNYVLVELPHSYFPGDTLGTVYGLLDRGMVPIIAHPERNKDVLLEPDLMADLVEAGALVQLTAASNTGELGTDIQRCAHYLLENNLTHFIATDSHSPSFRTPVLGKAHGVAVRLLGRQQADLLTAGNPEKILRAAGKIPPR